MVLASGAFDGIHAGHVRYLSAAKALCHEGELLIVAVAPDTYIEKAKHRNAYWSQADRVEAIEAIDAVDAAVSQESTSVAALIQRYRPRIFVKGPDWQGRLPEEVQLACQAVGTAMAFVETPGKHTSEARG